jgi:hypothetical protein
MVDTLKEINERADRIGTLLLERACAWTPEDTLAQLAGETGYAVRWYVYQLREAGYRVEAVKTVDPDAFRSGARGYKLTDIQAEPYRPADHAPPVAEDAPLSLAVGAVVEHVAYGRGRVTFAHEGAPKVVVQFKRKRIERVEREALVVLGLRD